MSKLWKLKSQIPLEIEETLSDYTKLAAQLLYNRGLTHQDQIENFVNPLYEKLHSPFLFQDMQKAVDRIWQAINNQQQICIYGDYDADAVTANAVLQQTFRHLGVQVESYIPDRFTEGYGINLEALQKIKDKGSKIIITVDCGTNSRDAADFCNQNDIDLIITDHHEIIGDIPQAFALINPKNQNDNYPYSEITGVGVAFKLACGILKDPRTKTQVPNHVDGYEKWLLDLVAIGTVADCHSLLDENRIFVKYGLRVLAKTKWVGLRAILALSGLLQEDGPLVERAVLYTKPLDTYSLGFVIAPRLNAAGRLEHADNALKLLMETDFSRAKILAIELEGVNKKRQDITARILSEAREQAQMLQGRKILMLAHKEWHKGVVGLVAGKIAEEFVRPTIVLERGEMECTGSARSVGEFNIVEALRYSSQHLVRFGGHKQAAGLTLQTASYEIFYQKVLEYADKEILQDALPVLELEAQLLEKDLSLKTLNDVEGLAPFGVGNPKPKFLISGVKVLQQKQVGNLGQHLQLKLQVGNTAIPAIAFNFKPVQMANIDLACELIEDGWNGSRNLKLRIVDVRHSNNLTIYQKF